MASISHEKNNIETTLTTTTTSPTVSSVAPPTDIISIDDSSTNIVDDPPPSSTMMSTSIVHDERSVSSPTTTDAESTGVIPSISRDRRDKGKRKIKMQKMENEYNLQVTFSKRRAGLFKKANELITLCKCQLVLVIFSPAKKVFTYGHPSVDNVIDRYLVQNVNPNGPEGDLVVPRNPLFAVQPDAANIQQLNEQITSLTKSIREEKNKGQVLDERQRARMVEHWWEMPVREMNPSELSTVQAAFHGLRINVTKQAIKLARNFIPSLSASSVPYFGYGSENPNADNEVGRSGYFSLVGGYRGGYNGGGHNRYVSDALRASFRGGINQGYYSRVNVNNADPVGSNGHYYSFRGFEDEAGPTGRA